MLHRRSMRSGRCPQHDQRSGWPDAEVDESAPYRPTEEPTANEGVNGALVPQNSRDSGKTAIVVLLRPVFLRTGGPTFTELPASLPL